MFRLCAIRRGSSDRLPSRSLALLVAVLPLMMLITSVIKNKAGEMAFLCHLPCNSWTKIMIFICTCSQDGATDFLSPHLAGVEVFRFNIDKREDYIWDFSRCGFEIKDVISDNVITSGNISSFYLRKPLYINAIDVPKEGCLENWCREEVDALFEDFYLECASRGLTILVHGRSTKYGKCRQLLVAEKYFNVANWHFLKGFLPDGLKTGKWVAKSFSGSCIGKDKVFFVKEVDPTKLDLSYPWFLQEKIEGEDEVTVVYVNGQLFAYRYPRSAIGSSEDVRKATLENASPWEPCALSQSEQNSILDFMAETGYRFGRFDFIRKDGELWFLELNPNGQWAWLDEDNSDGLISAIAKAIVEEDELHHRLRRA